MLHIIVELVNVSTQEAASFYRQHGYALLPGFFSPEEIAEIRVHIDRVATEVIPVMSPGDYVLEADGKSVRNMFRLAEYDSYFAGLGNRQDVVSVAAELLGGTPVLLGVETFNKPARQGSAIPAHQDNAYFCLEPPDALTLWVAVDPVTRANGPVSYLPGTSHELRPHKASGIPGNSTMLAEQPSGQEAAAAEPGLLSPGDVVVHHCQTIHWSEANRSAAPRCGMLLVYRSATARTAPDLQAAYDAARAMLAARMS